MGLDLVRMLFLHDCTYSVRRSPLLSLLWNRTVSHYLQRGISYVVGNLARHERQIRRAQQSV